MNIVSELWRGYIGIEVLGLTGPQKKVLADELEALGPVNHFQPAYLCHWRTRLDNDAAIYEAQFHIGNLTIAKTKQRLGTIFGVDPATIDHAVTNTDFAGFITQVITFSRGGVDRLRFALFGGSGSDYNDSHSEVLGYLFANLDQWQTE